jgi:K+-sensing histidine kinase KdpD
MDRDVFDGNHLMNGLLVTVLVGLALVPTPAPFAVAALVVLAFACGRLGGRDAGMASVTAGALMFGYAITTPHFRWAIENQRDVVLLLVLLATSTVAAEIGAHRRVHQLSAHH